MLWLNVFWIIMRTIVFFKKTNSLETISELFFYDTILVQELSINLTEISNELHWMEHALISEKNLNLLFVETSTLILLGRSFAYNELNKLLSLCSENVNFNFYSSAFWVTLLLTKETRSVEGSPISTKCNKILCWRLLDLNPAINLSNGLPKPDQKYFSCTMSWILNLSLIYIEFLLHSKMKTCAKCWKKTVSKN